jgi:hypothetical protein
LLLKSDDTVAPGGLAASSLIAESVALPDATGAASFTGVTFKVTVPDPEALFAVFKAVMAIVTPDVRGASLVLL